MFSFLWLAEYSNNSLNELKFLQGSLGRRWEWWSLGQAEGEEISQLRTICQNTLQEAGVEAMM